jgi:adenosylcobinamide-GDP ribazoletransferase
MLRTFWLALSTLSRLPTPNLEGVTPRELVNSAVWYPLVGALLGALIGLVDVALQFLLVRLPSMLLG